MVQSDGFHISVKARTSRPLSIIRSLMSNALLQTERAFNYPMVIFAAASMGVNSASMGVNSADDISHDLDLGCHILYLNKDFLTLRLSLWEWRRDLNSAALYLRRAGACLLCAETDELTWLWRAVTVSTAEALVWWPIWGATDMVWYWVWAKAGKEPICLAWHSSWAAVDSAADGLMWYSSGPAGVTSAAAGWVARHWLLYRTGDHCKPL